MASKPSANSSSNRDRIDLLLLDVVMPKMNGPEAYARMSVERPDVPVIFATGYSADIALLHESAGAGIDGHAETLRPARPGAPRS